MSFNASRRVPRGAASALLAFLIAAAAIPLLAPAPALAGEAAGKAAPAELTAAEKQAIAAARGGWWLAGLARARILHDLDPNAIPILIVGGRPGPGRFAILVNHPEPPAGFALAAAAGEAGPAAYLQRAATAPRSSHVPVDVGGKPTAVLVEGETVREGPDGAFPGERTMTAVLHQMVHVHMASKGLTPSVFPAKAPVLEASPMLLAMTAVENRILTDALYLDPQNTEALKAHVEQFLAVRRARRALMGEAADYERRVELWESVPSATELEVIRILGSRTAEPPPVHGDDPTYAGFKYALFQRVTLFFDTLVQIPLRAEHLLSRPFSTGPAEGVMLSRLGYAWNDAAAKPATDLSDLLGEVVPLTSPEQSAALEKARKAYDFEAYLSLFREKEAK